MPNGVRNSIWALFFLAGMAFMATLLFMLRPDLFSKQAVREKPAASRVIAGGTFSQDEQPLMPKLQDESLPAPPEIERYVAAEPTATREAKVIAVDERASDLNPYVLDQRVTDPPLPSSSTKAAPTHRPVEFIHQVRPGRSVFGHERGATPGPGTAHSVRKGPTAGFAWKNWLSDMDSNHDKSLQRALCYHYTIGQTARIK